MVMVVDPGQSDGWELVTGQNKENKLPLSKKPQKSQRPDPERNNYGATQQQRQQLAEGPFQDAGNTGHVQYALEMHTVSKRSFFSLPSHEEGGEPRGERGQFLFQRE